ncbi:hypothetical protein CEXT_205101 [Caerostris extrusa]|uniref:Endonuclease/exonuclease/phosphatase domain-containing protein n=1 Tax=Caerostris extrusa TaxID=172846 RepID=A0AAV4SLQ4_CAEEX|nr:hypothetical protein CEXT_205101 [Caerostris extrusa]
MFSTPNRRSLQNLHSLRIGCWNACGLRRQFDEVIQFVTDHDIDIFLIQETFLQPGRTPNIPNFSLYKNDRISINSRRTSGGTCIYVKKALVHYQIPTPELESTEATIINLNIGNKNQITFISIYCKTHHRFNTNDINKLLNVNRYVIIQRNTCSVE